MLGEFEVPVHPQAGEYICRNGSPPPLPSLVILPFFPRRQPRPRRHLLLQEKKKQNPKKTTVISADAPVNLQKMNQPRKQKPKKNSGFSIENRKKGVLWLVIRGGEVHGVLFFMGSRRGCGGKLNMMTNQEWWGSIIMSQFGWTSLFPGRGL